MELTSPPSAKVKERVELILLLTVWAFMAGYGEKFIFNFTLLKTGGT